MRTPVFFYYTGRFIKNQQTYAKTNTVITSAWRNKNSERKGKKEKYVTDVYTTFTKRKKKKKETKKSLTHNALINYIQNRYECMMAAK